MQCSIFCEANRAMREVSWASLQVWRPFIFHLERAMDAINARSAIVFRGLHLGSEKGGTVRSFLDGTYTFPRKKKEEGEEEGASGGGDAAAPSGGGDEKGGDVGEADDAERVSVTYHIDETVLWPSFSSTTTDPTIALAYATKRLGSDSAAVIFKIHTRRACPIREFSYYPFEEELLYRANTAFRVKALLEPTSSNLRRGVPNANAAFNVSAGLKGVVETHLTLEEACRKQKVLIEMQEVELPKGCRPMKPKKEFERDLPDEQLE